MKFNSKSNSKWEKYKIKLILKLMQLSNRYNSNNNKYIEIVFHHSLKLLFQQDLRKL